MRCNEIPQRPVWHESLVLQPLISHGAELAALQPGGDRQALVAEAVLQISATKVAHSCKALCRLTVVPQAMQQCTAAQCDYALWSRGKSRQEARCCLAVVQAVHPAWLRGR